jgi:hypothetical protein
MYWRFKETYCLNFHPEKKVSDEKRYVISARFISTRKMEAARNLKCAYPPTRRHNPEDSCVHAQCCEKQNVRFAKSLESLAVAQRRQTATVIKNVFTCER